MTRTARLAAAAAVAAAVVALAVDWDPDEPARRSDMSRHPSARPRPVQGCSCTLCRARYGGVPLVMTAPSPAAVKAALGRPVRIQLSDEEVFARFAGIVFADRRRIQEDS